MKIKIKKVLFVFLILLNIYSLKSIAQTDTSFWFVAPWVTPLHETNYPMIFHLTSFGQASRVVISMPATGYIIDTVTIPANQMVNIDVTSLKWVLENSPSSTADIGDTVLPKGIHISATNPITAYYQVGATLNPEIFVLKGKNSLGTNFVIPGQNKYSDDLTHDYYNGTAKSAIDIVATEDNTTVKVVVSKDAGVTPAIPAVVKWTKVQLNQAQGGCQPVYKWTRVQLTTLTGNTIKANGSYGTYYPNIWEFADTSVGYSTTNYNAPTSWTPVGTRSDTIWIAELINNPKDTYTGTVEDYNYSPWLTNTIVQISAAFTGTVWQIADTSQMVGTGTQPAANDPGWVLKGISDTTWYVNPKSCSGFAVTGINQPTPTYINVTLKAGTPAGPAYLAGDTITIHLNKGDSYSIVAYYQTGAGQLVGSVVTSNKPIAVSIKDDSMDVDHCQDLVGDQIVPENVIGTEYVGIRGYFSTSDGPEGVFITATQNATTVTVNGILKATLNAGATYFDTITTAVPVSYIQTSKPAYAFQITGVICEAAGSLLPQLICTGSQKVAFSRYSSDQFTLKLLASNNIVNDFYLSVNNGPQIHIDSNRFEPVPGTNYMYASITYNTDTIPLNEQCVIQNTKGIFQMGFLQASGGTEGAGQGYFSNFGYGGSSTSSENRFAGCDVSLSVSATFTKYVWTNENFNIAISDTTNTLTFKITNKKTDTIVYSMASNGGCLDTVKFVVTPKSPFAGFKQKLCANGLDSIQLRFDTTQYYTGFKWIDSLHGDSTHLKIYVKLHNKDTIVRIWFFDHTCISPADTFIIGYFPPPQLKLPHDTIICNGSPLRIYNLDTNATGMTFKWSTGATTDTITPPTTVSKTDSTYYKLTITNGCNESLSDSMKVVVLHNVSPSVDTRYTACSVNLQVSAGKKSYDWYLWQNNAWLKIDSITNQISVKSPDTLVMTVSNPGICNDTNYFYIHYKTPIAGFDSSLCGTGMDTIPLSFDPAKCLIPGATFHWFNKISGDSIHTTENVDQTGVFDVYFWDGTCLADSGVFHVKMASVPQLLLPPDTTVCNGSPVKIYNLKSNPSGMIFSWSTGSTKDTIYAATNVPKTETLSYILTVTNSCNFSGIDTMNVKVLHDWQTHDSLSYAACKVNLQISPINALWLTKLNKWDTIAQNASSISAMYPDTLVIATYNTTVPGITCTDTNFYHIVYINPKAGFTKKTCAIGNDSIQLFFYKDSTLIPGASFNWFNGNTTDTAIYVHPAPQDIVNGYAVYYVYFRNVTCLADSGKFIVTYYPNLTASFTTQPTTYPICTDSAYTVFATLNHPEIAKMLWFINGENTKDSSLSRRVPFLQPTGDKDTVSFSVKLYNKFCPDSTVKDSSLAFAPCDIKTHNVFTPNGDGINDWFYIDRIDTVKYLQWQVIIYNRWGRKVWETNDYQNIDDPNHSWHGEGAPEGVYYFVVRNFKKNLKYTGFVELIR